MNDGEVADNIDSDTGIERLLAVLYHLYARKHSKAHTDTIRGDHAIHSDSTKQH
jgi:hypothetical protein